MDSALAGLPRADEWRDQGFETRGEILVPRQRRERAGSRTVEQPCNTGAKQGEDCVSFTSVPKETVDLKTQV